MRTGLFVIKLGSEQPLTIQASKEGLVISLEEQTKLYEITVGFRLKLLFRYQTCEDHCPAMYIYLNNYERKKNCIQHILKIPIIIG